MEFNFTAGFEVWLELNGQYLIGKKEIEILEHIRQQGSFMRAAKTLGLSYAHAWNSIDNIQKILGAPLVEARRGGASGGGATLTYVADNILSEYHTLQKKLLKSTAKSIISKQEANLFKKKVWLPDITVIGSNSIGIELIIEQMLSEKKFSYEIVNVGSSGGLNAIMLGEADIAGVHLSD
jgi:molybdate transport system regulatory protein